MQPELKQAIEATIKSAPVVVFMKGSKDIPQCGFSAQVAKVFRLLDVDFVDVNVLENDAVREGIKEYNNWPTIPQVFVNGEFIGGCDIVVEMFQNGELKALLDKSAAA